MMRLIFVSLCLSCGWLLPASQAQGDVAAGQAKSTVCAACHGADGNSANAEWPSLAGQHESYMIAQLKAFKTNDRVNALMNSQAMGLSETDMADLAAYYSGQSARPTAADPAIVASGERLYRSGDVEREITACAACHGPNGRGNAPAGMPAIAGQKDNYVIAQLKAYAAGTREADSEVKTSMMQRVASNLSDDDMRALASFVGGLQ